MSGVVTVNGIPASQVRLLVPATGLWQAEVLFPEPPNLTGPVSLEIDGVTWLGTVADEQSGTFATRAHLTIVGGRGGWRRILGAKHEHDDGTLSRAALAQKVAAEAGESIVVDSSLGALPVGVDWVRRAGPASTQLEQLFPEASWWVDNAGVTQVGTRPLRDVSAVVTVLEYSSAERHAELGVDSTLDALPGCSFLDPRAEGSLFVIGDLEYEIGEESIRAYVMASEDRDGPLLALIRQLVERSLPRSVFERVHRFRVVGDGGDGRLALQPVIPTAGLPDMVAISVAPGVAGTSSVLVPGAEVGVGFLEADPALPYVATMPLTKDPARVPTSTKIEALTRVQIGGLDGVGNPGTAAAQRRFVCYDDMVNVGTQTAKINFISGPLAQAGPVIPAP